MGNVRSLHAHKCTLVAWLRNCKLSTSYRFRSRLGFSAVSSVTFGRVKRASSVLCVRVSLCLWVCCTRRSSPAQRSARSFSSVQFSVGQLGSKQRGSSTTDFRSVPPTLHNHQYCSQFHLTSLLINKELTQKLKSSSFTPPKIVLNPSVIPWNTKEHILKNVRATLYSSSEWGMTVQNKKSFKKIKNYFTYGNSFCCVVTSCIWYHWHLGHKY